ncbi:MAG TPA: ABC-type transport auxiliary lipoprotein family protein [Burkholderiaceae bacterium]|nr:ABC-type transport auxiliary lipoprotein family protein [Burkholderiaceae bacterium]
MSTPPRASCCFTAPAFYRTRELAYSKAAGTRGYYQYNSWTEPPAVAVGSALMARLAGSGAFRAVAPTSSGVNGTILLRVQLDDLYHDATTSPGVARVVLTAQLSDPLRRTLIATRTFAATAPATSYDADGAVAGLRQALDLALDDLVTWAAARR